MKKKIPKFVIAIVLPIIAYLIWFLLFWAASSILEILIFLLPFVMVIASLFVFWLVRREQYIDLFQLEIMLVISNILFEVMMGFVAIEYPNYLPEGPNYAAALLALITLGVTGIFLVFLIQLAMGEYIERKKSAKPQILEHDDSEDK